MKPYIILAVLAVLLVAWFVFTSRNMQTVVPRETPIATSTPTVLSFADCVRAGYPVMESSPRQCKTPDGRTYAEEPSAADRDAMITYKNANADNITVETPWPGAVTGKTFTVKGEARGPWYFEASFPVRVVTASGTVITTAVAQAQGEWMTEDFVPFAATVTVPPNFMGEAFLVLERDNPSGLPEHDASMMFPITIEY
jgi:hypothetical protein